MTFLLKKLNHLRNFKCPPGTKSLRLICKACGSTHYVAPEAVWAYQPCASEQIVETETDELKFLNVWVFLFFNVMSSTSSPSSGELTLERQLSTQFLSALSSSQQIESAFFFVEVLGNSYTLKADLWSLGVISYMLLTGTRCDPTDGTDDTVQSMWSDGSRRFGGWSWSSCQ